METLARDHRLIEHLEHIPRERWNDYSEYGCNLVFFACLGNNVRALAKLIKHGVNARKQLHYSIITYGNTETLKLMIVGGAKLSPSLLDETLSYSRGYHKLARVLIANGLRLRDIRPDRKWLLPIELRKFEEYVLHCRSIVITLLGIKRRSVPQMAHLDRFLIRHLAVEIWSARYDELK